MWAEERELFMKKKDLIGTRETLFYPRTFSVRNTRTFRWRLTKLQERGILSINGTRWPGYIPASCIGQEVASGRSRRPGEDVALTSPLATARDPFVKWIREFTLKRQEQLRKREAWNQLRSQRCQQHERGNHIQITCSSNCVSLHTVTHDLHISLCVRKNDNDNDRPRAVED